MDRDTLEEVLKSEKVDLLDLAVKHIGKEEMIIPEILTFSFLNQASKEKIAQLLDELQRPDCSSDIIDEVCFRFTQALFW